MFEREHGVLTAQTRLFPDGELVAQAARQLLVDRDEIDRTYLPAIAKAQRDARDAEFRAFAASERARLHADIDRNLERQIGDAREAARQRAECRQQFAVDRDGIDLARTHVELSAILSDAAAVSTDALRATWRHVEPRLRDMAAKVDSQQLKSTSSAFTVWTMWQARVATSNSNTPTEDTVRDAASRRKADVDRHLQAIAAVVAIDPAARDRVEPAPVPDIGDDKRGHLTYGSYWETKR